MFSLYDRSRAINILYIDFKKAFDKVPFKRIMGKIKGCGIIDEAGDWREDWLTGTKHSCYKW